jgi:hypothetical protein
MRDENQPKNVDDTSAYVDGIQNPDSPPLHKNNSRDWPNIY